jgi:integrase
LRCGWRSRRSDFLYRQDELNRLFALCNALEKTIFATFLLTGFREEELCFLTWADVDLRDPGSATLRVSGNGKAGFSPKDYEERILPIPQELAELLAAVSRSG